MSNGCNFCNDYFLETGAYTGPLEACESGFSVKLVVNNPVQFDQLTVQFTYQTTGNIVITDIATPLCGITNNCPPAGQTQPCVTVDGNKITYQACPAFASPTQATLLDVKFTGVGCISDITFTDETKVVLPLQGECVPMDVTSSSPFPVCNTCFQGMYVIGGAIETETGKAVKIEIEDPNEGIYIRGADNSNNCSDMSIGCEEGIAATARCGNYDLNFMCSENALFSVKPIKDNGDDPNGVSTFDLVLITKHILGTELLDSPYKIIAADANKSGMVTTLDLVAIRKLILFIETTFPDNTSWRFVDASYSFPNPLNPWEEEFPECRSVNLALQNADLDVDFVAVKIGDVNNSVNACTNFKGIIDERSQSGALKVVPSDELPIKAGELIELNFRMDSPEPLVAWQMGLKFDPAVLKFEEAMQDGLERFSPYKNLGDTEAKEGRLRLLWYAEDARPNEFNTTEDIFTLKFRVLRSIEDLESALTLDAGVLPVVAYKEDGSELSIHMEYFDSEKNISFNKTDAETLTVTPVPNPFKDELKLMVSTPEDDWIVVELFDAQGNLHTEWQGETLNRRREVIFKNSKNWSSGTFSYRVRSARYQVSGKVLRQ